MNNKFDFIAELKYRTTKEGGRKTPANSGYRPHLEFDFTKMLTSGHQFFIGTDSVNPGESIFAQIGMNSTHHCKGKLEIGTEFKFCEGSVIIGFGIITEIINKSLEKKKAST